MSCFNWKEKASCAILIPKVSAAASLMEMALALVSLLWLYLYDFKELIIGAFSIFSGEILPECLWMCSSPKRRKLFFVLWEDFVP